MFGNLFQLFWLISKFLYKKEADELFFLNKVLGRDCFCLILFRGLSNLTFKYLTSNVHFFEILNKLLKFLMKKTKMYICKLVYVTPICDNLPAKKMLLDIYRIRSKTPALKQLCNEHKSLLTQQVYWHIT